MTITEAKESMIDIIKYFVKIENITGEDCTQYVKDCEKVLADFDDIVWRLKHD